jgi:hypothetical protein
LLAAGAGGRVRSGAAAGGRICKCVPALRTAIIGQAVKKPVLTFLVLMLAAAIPVAQARTRLSHAQTPRILVVGAGQTFERPSDAALVAQPGDTVQILPGRYVDCAVWTRDGVTIEGKGDGVVLADLSCEREAIFVIAGANVTVRNVTFTGAHVINHNGAGIRAQGANLTVENVRFIKNEEGILSGENLASTIIVRDSYFSGNGTCIAACAHGIYAGRIARLVVEHCEFVGQHQGHHIKSRAERTEILDNIVRDGPDGTASYLVDLPIGGSALIRGNRFEKGPHAENKITTISVGGEMPEQQNRPGPIDIQNNAFVNDTGVPTVFVRNYGAVPVHLQDNRLSGAVTPLVGKGSVEGRLVQTK